MTPAPDPAHLADVARAGTVRLIYDALWSRRAADHARTKLLNTPPAAPSARVLWALIAHHDGTRAPWPDAEPMHGSGRVLAILDTAQHLAADPPTITPAGPPAELLLRQVGTVALRRGTLAHAAAPDPGPWERLSLTDAIRITQHAATYAAAAYAAEALAAELAPAEQTA